MGKTTNEGRAVSSDTQTTQHQTSGCGWLLHGRKSGRTIAAKLQHSSRVQCAATQASPQFQGRKEAGPGMSHAHHGDIHFNQIVLW